jgi:murein DD-endopeptidase MepM/ murein hydrolase activator NlpD
MAAMRGTPIRAAADGVIVEACRSNSFGKTVLIRHSNRLKTRYAHLQSFRVRHGIRVRQGAILGYVGHSGRVRGKNGDHLHFEVIYNNRPVNPMRLLS